jgi:hypothetical protein
MTESGAGVIAVVSDPAQSNVQTIVVPVKSASISLTVNKLRPEILALKR